MDKEIEAQRDSNLDTITQSLGSEGGCQNQTA